jgi:hypothetical protein
MKPFNENGTQRPVFNDGDIALHGDVIVIRGTNPEDFSSFPIVQDSCIAYGESTGHMHKIFGEPGDFELRENPKTKERHLKVVRPVMLKHQEHSPIELPPGEYRTGIQQEWDVFERLSRKVID